MKLSLKIDRKLIVLNLSMVVLGSAIVIGSFFLNHKRRDHQHPNYYPAELGKTFPCPGKTETLTNQDPYLPGVFKPGDLIQVTWNWYACHTPKAGEIALVRISRDLPPHPKIIRAVSGDTLSIKKDKKSGRWNLFVNGSVVLDDFKNPYAFGAAAPSPIGRYIDMHGDTLESDDVVVFSTRSPGEFDSGIFGVIGGDDLVAKVELATAH